MCSPHQQRLINDNAICMYSLFLHFIFTIPSPFHLWWANRLFSDHYGLFPYLPTWLNIYLLEEWISGQHRSHDHDNDDVIDNNYGITIGNSTTTFCDLTDKHSWWINYQVGQELLHSVTRYCLWGWPSKFIQMSNNSIVFSETVST